MAPEQPVFAEPAPLNAVPQAAAQPSAAPVAAALGRLAEAGMQIGAILKRNEQERDILAAKVEMGKRFLALEQRAAEETDFESIHKMFKSGVRKLDGDLAKYRKDGYTARQIDAAFASARLSADANVTETVLKKSASDFLAKMATGMEALRGRAMKNPDHNMQAESEEIQALYDAAFRASAMDRKTATEGAIRDIQQLHFDRVEQDSREAPQTTLGMLQNEANYPALKGAFRARATEAAENRMLKAWDTQWRMEQRNREVRERELKARQDKAAQDTIVGLYKGTVTARDIADHIGDYSKDDGDRLLSIAAKQDAPGNDSRTYSRLKGAIYVDGRDVARDILAARDAGLLTNSMTGELLGENRTVREAGGGGRAKKPTEIWGNWLHTQFFGPTGMLDIDKKLSQEVYDRGSEAIAAYWSFVNQNPGGSPDLLEKEARRLRDSYGETVRQVTVNNAPLPSADVWAGTRMEPDFPQMKANNERLRDSEPERFQQNAVLIDEWHKLIHKLDMRIGAPNAQPKR